MFGRNESRRIVSIQNVVQNVGDRQRHLRQTVMDGSNKPVAPDASHDANGGHDASDSSSVIPQTALESGLDANDANDANLGAHSNGRASFATEERVAEKFEAAV